MSEKELIMIIIYSSIVFKVNKELQEVEFDGGVFDWDFNGLFLVYGF